MNKQLGSGIISDLATLSFPIGLSIISYPNNKKDTEKENKSNNLEDNFKGGFLSENILIETGLSVLPFSLLALSDLYSNKLINDKDDKTLENTN